MRHHTTLQENDDVLVFSPFRYYHQGFHNLPRTIDTPSQHHRITQRGVFRVDVIEAGIEHGDAIAAWGHYADMRVVQCFVCGA